jgi:3-phenylpropionate/cinnamic acid dioxygenase small subunit
MGEHWYRVLCDDLYANGQDVYFSRLETVDTFFRANRYDALLYSMSHSLVESKLLVTADYVEQTIADRSTGARCL